MTRISLQEEILANELLGLTEEQILEYGGYDMYVLWKYAKCLMEKNDN